MSFDVAITVTVSTCRARLWIRAMQVARFVVGRARAARWAEAGCWRLARYRIGRGPWRRLEVPR